MKRAWPIPLVLLVLAAPVAVQAQVDGQADGFYYEEIDDTNTITGYYWSGGAVNIPATISGLPVTSIGASAFAGTILMTSVTIPGSVTSMGELAFASCGLTSVTISNGVTSIGDYAFDHCASLTGVTIPGSVTSIGEDPFLYCVSLAKVTIANGVVRIGESAFNDCTSLTNVTIPGSVTSIGYYAFEYCTSLSSVTIPGGVTNIGEAAFIACTNLTSVYFEGNAPAVGTGVFYDDPAIIYYLAGTTGWSNFSGGPPVVLWNPVIQAGDTDFGVHGNRFGFNIIGPPNIPVVVEASADLTSAVWSPLLPVKLTNGSYYYSEPVQTNTLGRSYRISSP